MKVKRYSWTQPVCIDCWHAEHPGDRGNALSPAEPETCCKCGVETRSGIYIRIDPETVAHPTIVK